MNKKAKSGQIWSWNHDLNVGPFLLISLRQHEIIGAHWFAINILSGKETFIGFLETYDDANTWERVA